jgi:hypothetical protein
MSLPISLLAILPEIVASLGAVFGFSVSLAKLSNNRQAIEFLEKLVNDDPELHDLLSKSYSDLKIDDLEMKLIKHKIEETIGSKFTGKFSLWGNKYTAAIKIVRDAAKEGDSGFFEELAEITFRLTK